MPSAAEALTMAQTFFQQGKIAEAESICQQLIPQLFDGSPQHLLGLILCKTERFKEGVVYLEKSLSLQPNNPDFFSNAAVVFKENNHLQTAENLYRASIELDPNRALSYFNLAILVAADPQRQQEAITLYSAALQRNPQLALAYNNRGRIYEELGNTERAMEDYRAAIATDSGCAEAYHNMGNLHFHRCKHRQALQSYEKSVALQPDNEDAENNIAACYGFLGELEKSIKLYNELIVKWGLQPDFCAGLAMVHKNRGDKIKAVETLRRILPTDLDNVAVLIEIAGLIEEFEYSHEEIISRCECALKDKELTKSSRASLHFALGDLYHALKKYERAFEHYRMGNEEQGLEYQQQIEDREMLTLEQDFTPELIARFKRSSPSRATPIFIVGMPRSGSTLTETILDSHPDVVAIGEASEMAMVKEELKRRLSVTTIGEAVALLTPQLADEMANYYFELIEKRLKAKATFYVDKNLFNFANIGLIQLLFPNAKIIHCYRHPLDTILSIYRISFLRDLTFTGSLDNIADYYLKYSRVMSYFEKDDNLDLTAIDHRELVADFEAQVRSLLDFCGLEWHEACLEFHTLSRYAGTASYDQVRQPLNSHGVDRWKKYERQLAPAIAALKEGGLGAALG